MVATIVPLLIRSGDVAGGELISGVPPLRLLIDRVTGDGTQRANSSPIYSYGVRGHVGAGRLVHERHEFIGEAGHGAADADAADVGATADARHPATLGDVAIDDGAPATDLHQTFG